jgi:hypothetical protein
LSTAVMFRQYRMSGRTELYGTNELFHGWSFFLEEQERDRQWFFVIIVDRLRRLPHIVHYL